MDGSPEQIMLTSATITLLITLVIIYILIKKLKLQRNTILGLVIFVVLSIMLPTAFPEMAVENLFKVYGISLIFSSVFTLFVYSHLVDLSEEKLPPTLERTKSR